MAVDLGSVLSAPEGIRTPNLLIRSQMLYPLSYGRTAAKATSDTLACGPRAGEIGATQNAFPEPQPADGVGD
jgi:hypothetical protein